MTAPHPHPTTQQLPPKQTSELLASGRVLRWWQATSFVEVAGPDAASFLDGLCTQAVERIEPGHARLGLFLDAKAKIIAPAVLHRLTDAAWTNPRRGDVHDDAPRFALETLPELVEPLHAHLRRYTLRAKASVEPVELSCVALVGDGPVELADVDGGVWTRVEQPGRPTHAFVGSADACRRIVADHADIAADPDAVEADRIEAGAPSLHDLLPGRMPAEVGGMDAAVALDAGCYLGQEPVARLHYRGHANRTLRRLEAEAGSQLDPAGGDADEALALRRAGDAPDARATGRLTTWARAADGRIVALAVLRRELKPGDELRLAGSEIPLRVVDSAPS